MSGKQKMFLILFRKILCPQQMFPSLRAEVNVMSNNVSTTMCPRVLTIYKNHPVGNFRHKHKTIKWEVAGEGIAIKYIHIS